MAGCAIGRKDVATSRQHRWSILGLMERAHSREDPQRLRVEGVAASVRNTVIVDGQGRERCLSFVEAAPRVEIIAREPAAILRGARVGVEVGIAAAYGAPVEQSLVVRALLREHAVQRDRLAWTGAKEPRDAVGQSVRMARSAAAPRVSRHLAPEIPRDEVANWRSEDVVVGNAERGEEGELPNKDGVLKAPRSRGLGRVNVQLKREAEAIINVHRRH